MFAFFLPFSQHVNPSPFISFVRSHPQTQKADQPTFSGFTSVFDVSAQANSS